MIRNYYTAKIFVRKCIADIRINDVPLFSGIIKGDLSIERPMNYLIESSGLQTITANMYPAYLSVSFPPEAECSVEIWRCDGSGHKIVQLETACSIVLKAGEKGIMPPVKTEKKSFFAEVGYQIARWSACDVLGRSKTISPIVANFLKNTWNMLAAKQFDRYAEIINRREQNICTSLYLDTAEIGARNRMLFDCLSNGFEPMPLSGHKKLQYYAGRRIVSVIGDDMKPALQFKNPFTGEILSIELLLGIPNGHKELCVI